MVVPLVRHRRPLPPHPSSLPLLPAQAMNQAEAPSRVLPTAPASTHMGGDAARKLPSGGWLPAATAVDSSGVEGASAVELAGRAAGFGRRRNADSTRKQAGRLACHCCPHAGFNGAVLPACWGGRPWPVFGGEMPYGGNAHGAAPGPSGGGLRGHLPVRLSILQAIPTEFPHQFVEPRLDPLLRSHAFGQFSIAAGGFIQDSAIIVEEG